MASPHRYLYQVGAGELHAYVSYEKTPPPLPARAGTSACLADQGESEGAL
jgi:hypothetical protein